MEEQEEPPTLLSLPEDLLRACVSHLTSLTDLGCLSKASRQCCAAVDQAVTAIQLPLPRSWITSI